LIVDDDRDTVAALLRLCALSGYPAYGAGSCHEALEVWRRERCPVVVADIGLPDGDGLSLMRELSRHGVRGVAVSGYTSPDDEIAALAAGFSAHLPKPVQFVDLMKHVDRLAPPPPRRAS
jgi:CheY-like chemotaxis protein